MTAINGMAQGPARDRDADRMTETYKPPATLSNDLLLEQSRGATLSDYEQLGRDHGGRAAKTAVELKAWKDQAAFWWAHANVVLPEQAAKLSAGGAPEEAIAIYSIAMTASLVAALNAAA